MFLLLVGGFFILILFLPFIFQVAKYGAASPVLSFSKVNYFSLCDLGI